MSLIFTKELVTNSAHVKQAYKELNQRREMFNINQKAMAKNYGTSIAANQAAIISKDYWREVEAVTTRVVRQPGINEFLTEMMAMATPIAIGKTAALYRTSSDAGAETVVTMSGQVPANMDKVLYDTEGDLVPILKNGYGVEWREMQGMSTEGLDIMADSQEAVTAKMMRDMANGFLNGYDITHNGYEAKGLTNHKNTQQIAVPTLDFGIGGSTNDEIIKFFTEQFAKDLDDQYIDSKIALWVSPDIKRRLAVPLSTSMGFKGGTLEQEILAFGRVEAFKQTFLLVGNHMVGYEKSGMFVRPRVAASLGSYMVPRNDPHANYQTMLWSAVGLQIKADFNGKKKAFNITGKPAVKKAAK